MNVAYTPQHPALSASPPSALLRSGIAIAQGEQAWISSSGAPWQLQPVISPLVRLDRQGVVLDTIVSLLARDLPDITLTVNGQWLGTSRQPFVMRSPWAARADGEGFVVVEVPMPRTKTNAALSVLIFDSKGKLSRKRTLPFVPVPVSSSLRDSVLQEAAKSMTPADGSARAKSIYTEALRQLREKTAVPAYLPPVTQLLVGNDGSIWIRKEDNNSAGGAEWIVLDSTGERVGRMLHPKGLRLGYADLRQVLAIETDADGIPWVVRLRVQR